MAHAQNEAVAGEEEGPEEQGTFLRAPKRGEFIGGVERAIGVVQDVADGIIVGERCPDESERSAEHRDEACDTGSAGGFKQALAAGHLRRAVSLAGRRPERHGADHEGIERQHEGEQKAKASELGHRMRIHREITSFPTILASSGGLPGARRHIAFDVRQTGLLNLGFRLRHQPVYAGEQVVGQQRLHAEEDVQAVVLLFGLFEPADDEHGDGRIGLA